MKSPSRPHVCMGIYKPWQNSFASHIHFYKVFVFNYYFFITYFNNSIILISRIDERQNDGEGLREAVINGICDRLRAVTLTSLTTVLGLAPLLFETSVQAQFLLPMVITIAWGLGFASLIVLFLVPSVLGIQEDIRKFVGRLRGAPQEPLSYQPSATPEAGRE